MIKLKYNKNSGDPIYNNQLVQLIVNNLMKKGKKKLAYRLCYQTMHQITEIEKKDPIEVFELAIVMLRHK